MTVRTLALATVLGGAVGCAPISQAAEQNEFSGEGVAIVVVRNDNWLDMNVYAVRNNMKVRLGTVTAMSEARLKLPRSLLVGGSDVRLLADPIGSDEGYATQGLTIPLGSRVDLRLANNIAMSSYSVW